MRPTALRTVRRCWPFCASALRLGGHKPAFVIGMVTPWRFIRAPMVRETAIHLHAPCFAGSEPHNEESSGASVRFLTGSPKDLD
jgi:hypothetical protein